MTQARILIVEDDPDTARMLEYWLRNSRYQHIGTAASGREAIALAGSEHPDLVLMECALPGELDGIETAGILLERYDIPVLYLTATTDEALFERARTTSPAACLTKPFSEQELGRAVEVALDRHALLRRLKASEAHLAETQAIAHIGSWRWDLQHNHVAASDEMLRLFDLTPDTFEPRFETLLQRIQADDQPRVMQAIETLLGGGEPGELEIRLARAGGRARVLRLRGSARFDGAGKALELLGSVHDVTDEWWARQEAEHDRSHLETEVAQRTIDLRATRDRLQTEIAQHLRTEASLWHSESRYRSLVEILPDSVFVTQGDQIIYANPAAVQLAGVANEQDLLGKSVMDLVNSDTRQLFEQRRQAAFANQAANPLIAYSLVRHDGSIIEVESLSFAFEYDGRPAFLIVMRDLTERRRTEQATEHFRIALDSSPDAIFLIDPATMRFIDANETACDSLGYTREELLARGPHDIKPLFNRTTLGERFDQVLSGQPGAGMIQTLHQRKDGSTFPVEVSLRPFAVEGNSLMVVVARDITARQLAELQLKESNERFLQFAENVNEVFWVRDLEEDRFLYISPAFETLFRKPVSSLYRNPRAFLGAVHPDDLERVTSAFVWQREHRQGIELEYRIIIGDNIIRWLWVRTFPVRNEQGAVYRMAGIAEDMTRRREYDEQYRTMIQASLDGFLALDTQGRIKDCNDAYTRIMGYSREELLQLSIADLDFRESPEQAAEHIRLITERGQDRFETQHLHKNGRLINMEVNIHYRPDSRGGQLLAFIHDISARKQAERTLHRSVARYRSILRAAPVGIGVLVHRVFQEVNEAMVRMTGYRAEELVGQSSRMLYPTQADCDHVGEEKYRQIQTHGIGSVETRWLRKDGKVIHILLSSSPIVEDDLAQGVTFTALDITASKQAEQERLVHEASQRNALVREVHHRIKNNLQGVIGLLRQHITENPGIQPVLESAIAQVNTVAVIHGLQSRLPQQELRLRELLREVSNAAAAMALIPHAPTIQDTQSGDVWLDSGATVTIALILNELIHNAFKHGRYADGSDVAIALRGDDKLTTVHISNPGDSWPDDLNLTTGTGCGTGLDLIRTLLPRHGAQLNLYEDGGMLHVELVLSTPVIHASGRAEQT